ncbi:uncharacterized protein LOC129605939 [Condylostylus longicornis]|uniref:uncharacterized protein LOC129605939 n=1 Tax=Condylostylus longicornis TaxID=2530218 RepID=UPI00244E299B|nr:uncharacterized protein LOC129605939 [Condylostylus longicornis]
MVDILKREKEFQKLNEELDKKTKSIIEKSSNLSSNNIKTPKPKIINNGRENREIPEKDDTSIKFHKSNTIPKRFRDILTNRKAKTVLEVSEKSVQISENEFSNGILQTGPSSEGNDDASLEKIKSEIIFIEEKESNIDENIELSEKNGKKVVKAHTVPKRLRDSLTIRKVKESKAHKLRVDSVTSEKCAQNEIDLEKKLNERPIEINQTFESTHSYPIQLNQNVETESTSTKTSKKCSANTDITAKKTLSNEGLVKYLKSKVSILEVELLNTKNEITKQTKDLERSYEMQQKLETQRDNAFSKNNFLTDQVEKFNEKLIKYEKKLKTSDSEIDQYKRNIEISKREIKVLNQTNKNLEKRLYRANEEIEKFKTQIDSIKNNERNNLETYRLEQEKLEKQVKDLKRQRNEFLNAYKKQLFLIDNLKRQNTCIEQCQIICLGEKQFSKILDLHRE